MKIGTKSLLFGAHLFWWHPLLVALAWYKLYGWSWVEYETRFDYGKTGLKDWRLWVAFVVHDWGYWGSPDMDGLNGTFHPLRGADIMDYIRGHEAHESEWWYSFMLYHSRAFAQRHCREPSPLAAADKLSLVYDPWWFYLFRVRLTGEIREYQSTPRHVTEHGFVGYDLELRRRTWKEDKEWWLKVRDHLRQWAAANRAASSLTSASPSATSYKSDARSDTV